MWTGIITLLGRGLWSLLERYGLVAGAYAKGRVDQAGREELQGSRARREAEGARDRLPDDERTRRVQQLER